MALIIFLCNEAEMSDIRQCIEGAKEKISEHVPYDGFWWTAGRTRKIQVGDRFLIQRTTKDPKGYFASGKIVAAAKEDQLRLADTKYSDLSEAYINDFNGGSFRVAIEVYSIVDFDYPLEIKTLRQQRQFIGANFQFQSCGCQFKAEYADLLYSEWEKHSMPLARKGFAIRLVDVWCDRGQKFKDQKLYQEALGCFVKALQLDSEYAKAKNGIQVCKSILERESQVGVNNANAGAYTNDASNDSAGASTNDASNDNAAVFTNDNVNVSTDDTSNDYTEPLANEPQEEAFYGSSKNNRTVEVAAIDFVTKYYERAGCTVTSVERDKVGYDLVCKKGNGRQDVEVKGLSGNQPHFIITANEVKQAKQNPSFILCVVTSALSHPTLWVWTGEQLLQKFVLEPTAYKAKLKNQAETQ